LNTLDRVIDVKLEEGTTDVPIWQWLRELVEKLGEDGMSSDESDTDQWTGLPTYRVKHLRWRRNMDNELNMVDKLRVVHKDLYSQ